MKVYLAVPLRNNRNRLTAKKIYETIEDLGSEVLSDWILLDDPNPGLTPNGIYLRDYDAISSCDLFLADVSKPSIGVGMEIMLAKHLGKKIICIYQNDKKVSNFLMGMPKTLVLSFDTINNLKNILRDNLSISK